MSHTTVQLSSLQSYYNFLNLPYKSPVYYFKFVFPPTVQNIKYEPFPTLVLLVNVSYVLLVGTRYPHLQTSIKTPLLIVNSEQKYNQVSIIRQIVKLEQEKILESHASFSLDSILVRLLRTSLLKFLQRKKPSSCQRDQNFACLNHK